MALNSANPNSSTVDVGTPTKAKEYNDMRLDALQAIEALDFGTTAEILAKSPAVGDAALASDTGFVYICTTAGVWEILTGGGNVATGRGYIDGLHLSNAAGDTINDIDFSIGAARDDTNVASLGFSTALTGKRIDAVFSAGAGNGMRLSTDNLSGAKWFYCYLLGSVAGDTNDVLATTKRSWEGDGISLPSPYDLKRYIGAFYWDGSAIKLFTQRGDYFRFDDPIEDLNDSSGTEGVIETASLTVPGVEHGVLAHLYTNGASGAGHLGHVIRTPGAYDAGQHECLVPPSTMSNYARVLTDGDGEVSYTSVGNWSTLRISTFAWEDMRGKNSIA